jgi:hypothetical protein
MDLYILLGSELRSLFSDLFTPNQRNQVRQKIECILEAAKQIGNPIYAEAIQLHAEILQYLKNPKDPHLIALMKKHALHLEQETREI